MSNQNQGARIEAERAEFEAWHRSKFATKHMTGQPTRDMHNGVYAENYGPKDQQLMWEVWQAARRTPAAPAGAGELPQWGAVHTVGDMVRNLLTLDQSAPIFTAFHVTIGGERRCRTRGITISRERVLDGKWIDSSRKDVPYANVIWAKQDERQAAPASAQPAEQQARAVPDGPMNELEGQIVDILNRYTQYFHPFEGVNVDDYEEVAGMIAALATQQGQPSAKGGDVGGAE